MQNEAWVALAEPNRRALLRVLFDGECTVGEIAARAGLSQPATSKHLRVLRDAGLVRVRQEAQQRWYDLAPEPFEDLAAWLAPYRRRWNTSLDRLGDRLDADTD